MKHRYSDFIVNEIDLNGDVVWFRSELDNQNKWKVSNIRETLPADIQKKLQQIEEDDSRLENDLMVPNAEITEGLKKILGEKETERFVQFCKDIDTGAIEQSSIHDFEGNFADKARRTEVHQFFKRCLKKYETDTLSVEDGVRNIRVFFSKAVSKKKRQKNNITEWGGNSGPKLPEYLSVALQKTNVETMQAVHYISKRTKKMTR